jgi:Alpha/beta hydrolase domain
VPLATTTGWNFRSERVGNPTTLYALLGSYVPFARTKTEREARRDPRPSIEERYRDREDYLQRIRESAAGLVKERFLLDEDVEDVVQRATRHWTLATATQQTN